MCADLRAETDDLRALLVGLTDEDWRTPTPAEGWSIKDTVSHLAYFDRQATLALEDPDAFAAHIAVIAGIDDPTTFVDEQVGQTRHISGPEILAWWDDERAALLDACICADPRARVPWYGPPMSARSKVTARLMETWAHGQDVVDALGCERVATDRIRHVCHIAVRARPFAFIANNLPVPDADVQVVLTGPSGDVWGWGDPDSGERIEGPAVDFALLACRRRHRSDLSLHATGRVADRWLDIAQAYAGPPGPGRRPRQFT
jgi:uncharacterized protein (TIGR03084 family)